MKKTLYILFLLFLMFHISSCRKFVDVKKETTYSEFEFQGENRSYLVHLPVNYSPEKKYPLIFVLHGMPSRAKAIAEFSGFTKQSDLKEFIVCYPQGYKNSWNIGVRIGPAPKKGIDDIAFFDKLIDTLASDYAIDLDRVYACGISNGGFMSASLASNLPNRIAAVALVCSNMFEPIDALYKSDVPMPFLIIGGKSDPLLAFEGSKLMMTDGYYSVGYPETVKYWVKRNKCAFPSDSILIDNNPKDKTSVIKYYSETGDKTNEVILYKVVGGGHAWPGRGKDFKSAFLGKVSSEINAAEVIADFFLSH